MNGPPTPTDPLQLLIYGAAMLIVWGAFRLLDRRREKKLQATAETAAGHAATAADAAVKAQETSVTRASARQAEELLQYGHDQSATLVQIARALGRVEAQVARLNTLPERVATIEDHLDAALLSGPVRRRQDRS